MSHTLRNKWLKRGSLILTGVLLLAAQCSFALESNRNLMLDDNNGDAPQVILVDGDDQKLILQKLDSGEANILNDEGRICFLSSGDTDDKICFVTSTDQPALMWDGIGDDSDKEPGIRVADNGKLQYRDKDDNSWVNFDDLRGSASSESVDSEAIINNTIVNADIDTSAAIAGSKINPDFGDQDISGKNITASGNLEVKAGTGTSSSSGDLTVDGTTTLNGNINLGNSVQDAITIKGSITAESNLSVGGSLKVGTVENASVPAGVIVMWSGALDAIPAGWALCNGEKPEGESVATPNLSGRFIVGYDVNNDDYDDISSFNNRTGGKDLRQLTISNMPAHTHGLRGDNDGWIEGANTPTPQLNTDRINKTAYTESSGGGEEFDNRPAYYVLAYIIKL